MMTREAETAAAKRELIERCVSYRDDVYRFVNRMTADAALSDDITQETLLRAVKNIERFAGRSELKTWLIAIAKNEVYSTVREKKRNLRRLMELRAAGNAAPQNHALSRHEEEAYLDQIKNGCLTALLTCLPFNQRAAFVLYALSGVSMETTAEILGKTENAARILVTRAKATIRRFLCSHCEHLEEAPRCRCLNMLNFSLERGLVKKVRADGRLETAKAEWRRFNDEVALLKSLPAQEWKRRIDIDSRFALIFSKEK